VHHLISKLVRLVLVSIVLVLGLETVAAAQGGGGELIRGFVRNEREEEGKTVRDPVAGVRLAVVTVDGAPVGEDVTDDDGRFEVPVPGPDDYRVLLDESTLPDGVSLRDEAQEDVAVNVRPGEEQILNFFLGEDTRKTEGRWSLLPQTLMNGLKFGLIIAICSIGLSLIYGTTGLSNFAHGELVTLGAIVTWYFNQYGPELQVLLAAVFGVAAAAAAGAGLERGVFRPLRNRGIGLTSAMIVSIGIGLAGRYLFQFFYGGRSRPYRQYSVQQAWDLGPFSVTPRELLIMLTCLVTLLAVGLFLQRTRAGKAVRAVSDNPALSSATGINTDRVILIVWTIGGALAGLGGVLLGLDQQVRWDMGFSLLLLMFAAITLGGLGSPFGALVGSIVIGLMVELWTWIFPDVIELKTMGALIALIVILLVRPQGLLGRKERVG
jgi:branched-chain amino acid transport system permease protein